jgi:transcriptional antiterminator NusG
LSEPEPKSVIEPVTEAEPVAEAEPAAEAEPVAEPAAEAEPTNENSHLFSVRTTGGQEKIVMRMLEARMKLDQKDEAEIENAEEERPLYDSTKLYGAGDKIKINQTSLPKEEAILDMNITEKILARFCFFTAKQAKKLDNEDEEDIEKTEEEQSIPSLLPPPKIAPDGKHSTSDPNWEEDFTTYPRVKNIQSVLLLDDLKGYVVVEADGASSMFNAVQGIRHVRGQLRGELGYNEIEKYLVKKSVVTELEIDKTVEIVGGPFKGMKATVSRVDKEKEEATVVLLDAAYELPITVDANYLKLIPT